MRRVVMQDRRSTLRMSLKAVSISKTILNEDLKFHKVCATLCQSSSPTTRCSFDHFSLNIAPKRDEGSVFTYDPESKRQSARWHGVPFAKEGKDEQIAGKGHAYSFLRLSGTHGCGPEAKLSTWSLSSPC